MVLYSVAAGLSRNYSIVFHSFRLKKYLNMTFLIRFWHLIVGEGKFIYLYWCIVWMCPKRHCWKVLSGKSSNHGEELFISQEKVDAFLANYSKRPTSKSTVCEWEEFFSYFVCCCFTLTFCYPSVLIPLLNHCNERPKVTVFFVACNNDVSVELFEYGTVWRVHYFGTGCLTLCPVYT